MSTNQLRGWRSAGREHTREIVRVERKDVEKLPQQYVDELERVVLELERFQRSQEFVMPKAFAEALERIGALETALTEAAARLRLVEDASVEIDITPAKPDTAIMEQVAALREDVEALQDNRDAHRRMIETAAGFADIARGIMRQVDENRARADTQYGVAMDHVKDLSATIRRAIG